MIWSGARSSAYEEMMRQNKREIERREAKFGMDGRKGEIGFIIIFWKK